MCVRAPYKYGKIAVLQQSMLRLTREHISCLCRSKISLTEKR